MFNHYRNAFRLYVVCIFLCKPLRHRLCGCFDFRDATARDRSRIEKEILSKCRNSKILHIGIDSASVEGCVYIRCVSKEDARTAFLSLHGWWFDGNTYR